MKRIILLIIQISLCATMFAQGKKTSTQVRYPEHLSFLGLSFGLEAHEFERRLEAKGFKYVREDENGIQGTCSFLGEDGFDYTLYNHQRGPKVNVFTLHKYYQERGECTPMLNKIFEYLKKVYPYLTLWNPFLVDEDTNFIALKKFNIFNESKNFTIGNIYCTICLPKDSNKGADLTLEYYDRKNYKEILEDVGKNYDLTSYTPYYNKCTMYVVDKFLMFDITNKENVNYSFYLIGNDFENFHFMFTSDRYDYDFKKDMIQRYLRYNAVPYPKNQERTFFCCTNSFEPAFNKYVYDLKEELVRKEVMETASNITDLGEGLFYDHEGLKNIIKYKMDGTYEQRLQNFRKRWNMAVDAMSGIGGSGGSGGSYMDDLSPAQRAIIHEHDNGK